MITRRAQPASRHAAPRGRAFTLAELLVALAVMAMLMAGLSGVFVVAARALPDKQSTLTAGPAALRAIERINADVTYATGLSSGSPTSFTITVPDRTGDLSPESITFSWSGTPGAPLLRSVNSSPAEMLLASVRALTFSYDIQTTTSGSAAGGTAAEQQYISLAIGTATNTSITSLVSLGQTFRPAMSADASSWSITRVVTRLRLSGIADGSIALQVRTVDNSGLPTSTVLNQVTIAEPPGAGSSTSYAIPVSGLTPGQAVAIVFLYRTGLQSCSVPVLGTTASPAGGAYISTATGGLTWSSDVNKCIQLDVYGQVTTPTTTATSSSTLQRLLVSLQADSDNAPVVLGSARPLNNLSVLP